MREDLLLELDSAVKEMEGERNLFRFLSVAKEGRIELYRQEDPRKLLAWTRKLVSLLSRLLSLVFRPAVVTSKEEEVQRVEVAGPLSDEEFQRTVHEPSFWSRKGGEMVPERVHATAKIDVDLTYENRFICMLIDMVDREIHDLLHLFGRREGALLDYAKDKVLSYDPTSLLSRFDSFAPYPDRREVLTKEEEVDALLSRALSSLKRLKASSFYRELVVFPIKGQVQATNVLVHHPLYSYCFRFYVQEFRRRETSLAHGEKPYVSYVLLSLLTTLEEEGYVLTPYGFEIREGRPRFQCLFARRGKLTFSLYEKEDGYLVCSHYLSAENNASLAQGRRNLLIRERIPEGEVRSLLQEGRNGYDDCTLATASSLSEQSQDHVLWLVPGAKASHERTQNYLRSLTLIFDEGGKFDYSCPVCHNPHLTRKEDGYYCPSCHAKLALFAEDGKDMVWLKGLWRSR